MSASSEGMGVKEEGMGERGVGVGGPNVRSMTFL